MNGKLDVEVYDGVVVAVWLDCRPLPFEQRNVRAERAAALDSNPAGAITSIEVLYAEDERA